MALAKDRIIVQSIDALGWHEFNTLNTGKQQRNQLFAGRHNVYQLGVVASGNTGPSHITAYTGITPELGGWVGNVFFRPREKKPSSAFTAVNPRSKYKHIVTKLNGLGYKTACLNAPTINRNLQCSLHLAFSPRIAPSCVHTVTSDELNLRCGEEVFHLAKDFAKITLERNSLTLTHDQAKTFCWKDGNKYYSRTMLLEKYNDKQRLYIGPKHFLNANGEFLAKLPNFTCWPGNIDGNSIRLGKISPTGFYQISELQNNYAYSLLSAVLDMPEYDAIFSYTPFLDSVQHELLTDSKHEMHTELSLLIEKAFNKVSLSFIEIEEKLGKNDNMLVFSDHGIQLSSNVVFITGLMREIGFNVQGEDQQVRVLSSGALGHVYFNGVSTERIEEAKRFLKTYKVGNDTVFNFVRSGKELVSSYFDHPNSGDLVLMLNPGFGMDTRVPPTSKSIYPSLGVPSKALRDAMTAEEFEFIRRGTSNRVSPGVHGFNSSIANIDGIIFGTGYFTKELIREKPTLDVSDVHSLIENVALQIKTNPK